MKPANQFLNDMLDRDGPAATAERLWRAGSVAGAEMRDGAVFFDVPFQAQMAGPKMRPDASLARRRHALVARAYGENIVRLTLVLDGALPGDEGPMLQWDRGLTPEPLSLESTAEEWRVRDRRGTLRLRVAVAKPADGEPAAGTADLRAPDEFVATVLPDGVIAIPFMNHDSFFPMCAESLSLAFIERDERPHRAVYSLHAAPDEHFCGTGERFARLDLAGRTLLLENVDALGVNNRRCYKNVPFYLSSRPYGLFLHTHRHARLSLADISTRTAQGLVEEPRLDLFFIGGGSVERILREYRRVTGFPPVPPVWTFGTWMSRMSYSSQEQVGEVAGRLREGGFPCDVLHLDIGWFDEDWVCDWEFSARKFPDPEAMIRELRRQGYRLSLWQLPHVARQSKLYADAKARGFVVESAMAGKISESIFSGLEHVATIDFTNPAAVAWYQAMLARLLRMGASAIKADFGEHIHIDADYAGMPGEELHNLFPVLYQKAVFETVTRECGEGVIWARAGWAGCQRYPVHWGGDAAGTWDGLAGSLRGGLHLGLSGFAFWSHDIPGFHGVPDFMGGRPPGDLYVRWTQFGVFTSHLRYHGTQPREPYEYPEIAPIVRQWLRLRYALIPYLLREARATTTTGYPLLRALVFHHADDPLCWHIDDQFYCGGSLLVAPVLDSSGVRDVYLPAGEWVDGWTGERFTGPLWRRGVRSPLDRIPLYAVYGSRIPVYPYAVDCTDRMDFSRTTDLVFDESFRGLAESVLGPVCER